MDECSELKIEVENNNSDNQYQRNRQTPLRNRPNFRRGKNLEQNDNDNNTKVSKFQPQPGSSRNYDSSNTGVSANLKNRFNERFAQHSGSTYDLPPLEITQNKFSARNRLFIGNLPPKITEEEFVELFKPFGEIDETFINNEKNFAFIRFDCYANAEKAVLTLDGTVVKGRALKVRLAPNTGTIKVSNLTPFVTNELLYLAFSIFGEIERCVVIVDDRGNSICEGIVEFKRKHAARNAYNHCIDECFFLTSSLRPVIVEIEDYVDDVLGFGEKSINFKTNQYYQERETGPRVATQGSFEYEYGTRWKQLRDLYKQKEMYLKQELKMEENKLEAQMKFAKFEHETDMLREQLRQREMDRDRQKLEWEEYERIQKDQNLRRQEVLHASYYKNNDSSQTNDDFNKNVSSDNNIWKRPLDPQEVIDTFKQTNNYEDSAQDDYPYKRRRY